MMRANDVDLVLVRAVVRHDKYDAALRSCASRTRMAGEAPLRADPQHWILLSVRRSRGRREELTLLRVDVAEGRAWGKSEAALQRRHVVKGSGSSSRVQNLALRLRARPRPQREPGWQRMGSVAHASRMMKYQRVCDYREHLPHGRTGPVGPRAHRAHLLHAPCGPWGPAPCSGCYHQ